MTTPTTEADLTLNLLDLDEDGLSEEEARRRRIERNKPLVALIQSWIDEAENATEEERRQAAEDWDELKRALDEHRNLGSKLFP